MTEKLLQIIRLLDSDNNGKKDVVESILEGTNGQETNIIEFKATPFRPQNVKNEKGGTREDDYKWNVLKAIIAFANTSGGVVFVGIKEDEALHELQPYQLFLKNGNDYRDIQNQNRDDKDEYIRAINERILQKTRFVTTPEENSRKRKEQVVQDPKETGKEKEVVYQLTSVASQRIQTLTTISAHTFRNHTVFAIRVAPGEYSEKLTVKRDNTTVFFVRRTAQVDAMTDYEEINSYKRPERIDVFSTKPFLHSIPAPGLPFVGRDKELEDLHKLLSPDRKDFRRIPVLTGADGIGKHTLACKFCEQYRPEYDTVINATDLKCAKDIYLELAGDQDFLSCFNISFDEFDDDEKRIKRIKHALFDKQHGHILILLENIQKPRDIFFDEDFPELFTGPGGPGEDCVHILATTSSELDWYIGENESVYPYEVKPLTEQEGMELLFQWRPFAKGGTEEKAALGIVRILEGHTGRLADAGKRLKRTCPLHDNDYADLLKKLEINPSYVQDEIEYDDIRDRVHRAVTGGVGGQDQSLCSIGRPVSKSFVGRIEELKKLNELVSKHDGNGGNTLLQIPVITGDAGVGKTELAVAYAYVFADRFPQGRFLIPMQGVTNWGDAMTKLVECCDNCGQNPVDILGLPEDFNKLPPDEKLTAVYRMLLKRARKGALLLLLDNLEDMRLISESDGLRELPGAWPANLHMIATTRINEASSSSLEVPMPFEIDNLKEKDALELFCKICDRVFPFADYPFEDGKLLVDLIPEENRPGPEKIESIERDYGVLREIIRLLDRHAWSVEIVAGCIAFKSKRMKIDIQKEWAGLRDNLLGNLRGKTYRSTGNRAESLLQQTFDLILKQDELVEGLGQKIMRLAEIASFFPPDQIPEYALRQIWIEQFGDEDISFEQDGMPLTGNAYEYALNQLIVFRLTGGEEPMFKMHRLTREVLHNRLTEEEKLEIVRLMRKCLDDNLEKNSNQNSQFLQPWCAWIDEWITALTVLQEDTVFLKTLLSLAESCIKSDMFDEAWKLLSSEFLGCVSDQQIKAQLLDVKGFYFYDLNLYEESKPLFCESLAIRRQLAKEDPEKYESSVAYALVSLALLHEALDRYEEANEENNEALALYRKLEERNPDKYSSNIACVLNNLALLHVNLDLSKEAEKEYSEALIILRRLAQSDSTEYVSIALILANLASLHKVSNRYAEAEAEFLESLSISRKLMEENPERYISDYAQTLFSLASFHKDAKQFQKAEKEYFEILEIYRKLAEKNAKKYNEMLATTLRSLANYHQTTLRYNDAEKEYEEALDIYRRLAQEEPDVYNYDFAITLDDYAGLHNKLAKYEDAKSEYSEALAICRKLAENNPQKYQKDVAMILNNYTTLPARYIGVIGALSKLDEALDIYRKLAESNPGKYNPAVASCLYNIGLTYCRLHDSSVALLKFSEALTIYRSLAANNPQAYNEKIANTLDELAYIHAHYGQISLAYTEYQEALNIFRELAVLIPSKYDSNIAWVLSELGKIQISCKQLNEAECNLSEALSIYRNLAEKKPEIYSSAVAMGLKRLADFHESTGCYEKAESGLFEALAIYRNLVQDNPDLNQNIITILNSLADLHEKLGKHADAEKEREEAIKIKNDLNQILYQRIANIQKAANNNESGNA